MTLDSDVRITDMLTEVGAYALTPTDQPRSIERTYEYYSGWRSCIMYLQDMTHRRTLTSEDEFRTAIDDAQLAGERMLSAFAYTHSECTDVDDLSDAALGDVTLTSLVRFARGWVAAAEKTDERLKQVNEHIFPNQ